MKLTSFLKTLVISILACTNILGQTFIIPRPVKYHTLKVRDIVQDPKISSLIPAVYSIYDSIKNDDEEIKPDDYLKIGDSSYSARNKGFDVEGNIIPITVPDNQLKVSIYSSGDLKDAISSKSDGAATGSLGLRLEKAMGEKFAYQLNGEISIASIGDTLLAGFGSSFITPKTGAFSSLVQFTPSLTFNNGTGAYFANFYTFINTTDWKYGETALNGSLYGIGLCPGFYLFRKNPATNNQKYDFASIEIHAGFTYRGVLGNFKQNADFLKNVYGSDKTDFFGLQSGLGIFYHGFTVGIDLYFIKNKKVIEGLTGGQIAGGISILADLVNYD